MTKYKISYEKSPISHESYWFAYKGYSLLGFTFWSGLVTVAGFTKEICEQNLKRRLSDKECKTKSNSYVIDLQEKKVEKTNKYRISLTNEAFGEQIWYACEEHRYNGGAIWHWLVPVSGDTKEECESNLRDYLNKKKLAEEKRAELESKSYIIEI